MNKKDDSRDRYEITQMGPDGVGRVTLHKRLRDLPETVTEIGTTVSGGSDWFLSIQEGDPNSCVWQLEWWSAISRGEWVTRTRSTLELSSLRGIPGQGVHDPWPGGAESSRKAGIRRYRAI